MQEGNGVRQLLKAKDLPIRSLIVRDCRSGGGVAMNGGVQARAELARLLQRLHARGWVANHDGNLSVRLRPGQLLCTPTATSKADVRDETLDRR